VALKPVSHRAIYAIPLLKNGKRQWMNIINNKVKADTVATEGEDKMRNLVIDELMALIEQGAEVYYGLAVEPIQYRKTLETMSNRELLDRLIDAYAFQG
jgi:hypothetical protein